MCRRKHGTPSDHVSVHSAGTIVRRLVGLAVAAGCDTAWDRTRICNDTASALDRCATREAPEHILFLIVAQHQ